MSIGHHPHQTQHTPDMRKKEEDITEGEKAEAKRRIEGSITPGDSKMPNIMPGKAGAASLAG